MKEYLDIIETILSKGVVKKNRTGVDAISIAGAMFEHDMSKGFPLLTTKKMPFRLISTTLIALEPMSTPIALSPPPLLNLPKPEKRFLNKSFILFYVKIIS